MFDPLQQLSPENQQIIGAVINQFIENSFGTRAQLFRDLNRVVKPGGIVFAGDSITEGYPVHELMPQHHALHNRGIGGLSSSQLLDHLDALVTGLSPDKVFLLIGTNDFPLGDAPVTIAERIIGMCAGIHKACPKTEIYLLSVYPVNVDKESYRGVVAERTNEGIRELNRLLAEGVVTTPGITYIDLHPLLANRQGGLKEEYTTDGLHITVAGYQKITEQLRPYIGEQS